MTDDPKTSLPGLPQRKPEPTPDPQADNTPFDNAVIDLQAACVEVLMNARAEVPNLGPADVTMMTVMALVDALRELVPPVALRTGLLGAFERSHTEPMSFIDINKAKTALEAMSDRRRREDNVSSGGIIIPGKD